MPGRSKDEARDELARGGGAKGVGVAVGAVIVTFFASLPFVLVVILYLFLSGYALAHGIVSDQGEDAAIIVVGFVLTTSLMALVIGLVVHLAGRSLTPKKRRAKA